GCHLLISVSLVIPLASANFAHFCLMVMSLFCCNNKSTFFANSAITLSAPLGSGFAGFGLLGSVGAGLAGCWVFFLISLAYRVFSACIRLKKGIAPLIALVISSSVLSSVRLALRSDASPSTVVAPNPLLVNKDFKVDNSLSWIYIFVNYFMKFCFHKNHLYSKKKGKTKGVIRA